MPPATSLFATYANPVSPTVMVARSMANELLPNPVRNYAISTFRQIFKSLLTRTHPSKTPVVSTSSHEASEIYLSTKIKSVHRKGQDQQEPEGEGDSSNLVMGYPYVLQKARVLREEQKARVLREEQRGYNSQQYGEGCIKWDPVNLKHPATFETPAMETELKIL